MTKRTDERLVLTGAAHSELSVRQGVTGHSAESRGLNRSATRAFIILGCFLLQGCGAGWRRLDPLEPGPLRVRQQAQVWHHGQADRWHAVVITPDSVSGVPYLRPAECDSCRMTIARAAVDSIRTGNPEWGFWKTAGLVAGISLLVYGVARAVEQAGAAVQPTF